MPSFTPSPSELPSLPWITKSSALIVIKIYSLHPARVPLRRHQRIVLGRPTEGILVKACVFVTLVLFLDAPPHLRPPLFLQRALPLGCHWLAGHNRRIWRRRWRWSWRRAPRAHEFAVDATGLV